ncbi:MAG TPA: hypothetical protein VNF73_08095 [Candidatus Saccharimonadales bacterium]|nr:hypothetical protein [Candidatus Saccharimonadales bacterium]
MATNHVHALSYAHVAAVCASINRLNPYDRDAVPDLLKIERENEPLPGTDGVLYAVALSSKRYALVNHAPDGGVVIRKASSHGLGLYRPPLPRRGGWGREWPEWVEDVWRRVIAEARGEDPGPEPEWFDLPAVSQASVSTPALAHLFDCRNAGRPYADQVKPFGFLLVGHADPLAALPPGLGDGPVTPVAPYSTDVAGFLGWDWVDRRTGRPVRVTTREGGEPGRVRLKTYRDVVEAYVAHHEEKSGRAGARRGRIGSVGVLPRLHVVATEVRHIGKESNKLDEEDQGFALDAEDAFTEYHDGRAQWEHDVLPRLREMGARRLVELTGAPERTMRSWLLEGRVPREPMRGRLVALAARGPDAP